MPNACSTCRWGGDEPDGKVFCYTKIAVREAGDLCQQGWEAKPMRDFGPPPKPKKESP